MIPRMMSLPPARPVPSSQKAETKSQTPISALISSARCAVGATDAHERQHRHDRTEDDVVPVRVTGAIARGRTAR